jgi:aminopeptidase-like protein/aminoglycoside N3'-acetyltransferase
MEPQYNREQMAQALRQVGLRRGDVVFSHSNVGYFGFPEEGRSAAAVFNTILGAFQDVIGSEGTLVVPTYTYSFPRGEPFDPGQVPSTCGIFTEMLRQHADAHRSHDPIISVVALGRLAKELTVNVPPECFGRDSFWDRFWQANGIICNLNFDAGATFVHFVERCLNVSYRYDKLFPGSFVRHGEVSKGAAIFFCRDNGNPETYAVFEPFDALARERGVARSVSVGRGAVVAIRAADMHSLIEEKIKEDPWFLTMGGKTGKTPVLIEPADLERFNLSLSSSSREEVINALWKLPRDLLSDGYDASLKAIAQQVPLSIHEYSTGTHCWTWIIPEKWTCHDACLQTLNGQTIFSYTENPLHVVSYSQPLEGEVSRAELFKHLHVHPRVPDAIPFRYYYYERDWGLCCSQRVKDSLQENKYKVIIKTTFSFATLKVGEVMVSGESDETILLCAHLDHPSMANDGLSGVVVGLEVMKELQKRNSLRYTYRLLIVPEILGSAAYLSNNEALLPKIKGGLVLEHSWSSPHALQRSFMGNTEVDQCFELAMREHDPRADRTVPQHQPGDEEHLMPGVRSPMLSFPAFARSSPTDPAGSTTFQRG